MDDPDNDALKVVLLGMKNVGEFVENTVGFMGPQNRRATTTWPQQIPSHQITEAKFMSNF